MQSGAVPNSSREFMQRQLTELAERERQKLHRSCTHCGNTFINVRGFCFAHDTMTRRNSMLRRWDEQQTD